MSWVLLTCSIESCLVVDHLNVGDHQSKAIIWFYFIWNHLDLIFVHSDSGISSSSTFVRPCCYWFHVSRCYSLFCAWPCGDSREPSRRMMVQSASLVSFGPHPWLISLLFLLLPPVTRPSLTRTCFPPSINVSTNLMDTIRYLHTHHQMWLRSGEVSVPTFLWLSDLSPFWYSMHS